MDYRAEIIKTFETNICNAVSKQDLILTSTTLTKILADYEIATKRTQLMCLEALNENLIKRYCACLVIEGKSPKTIYSYRRALLRFSEFIHHTDFTKVGVYDIRYYLALEKERGLTNTTLDNTRAVLSAFFQWMTNEEIITKNPFRCIKAVKCTLAVKKPFSDIEIDTLRNACANVKERALIEILLASGIRVEELSFMKIGDVDFANLTIIVRHGKGNKERRTYLTPVCAKYVQLYLDGRTDKSDFLFKNRMNNRLEPGGIRFILQTIAKREGVTKVHPHRFRRTFATTLADRGMDIQDIQRLLGHKDINTTLRYVCMSDNKVAQSYRKHTA